MSRKILSLCIVVFLLLAGCAPATSINTAQAPATDSSGSQTISLASSSAAGQQPVNVQQSNAPANSQPVAEDAHTYAETDVTHLPIGDGHVSTQPEVGSVWSCQTSFNGRGASGTGSWFNGDGTFDLTSKPVIDGSVTWPSSFTLSVQGDSRVFTGNDLPDHPTGNYPVSQNDDAYSYDHNPNSIRSQVLSFSLPANPTLAAQPQCVPGGPVGVLLTGSYIFNALDGEGRDAVAHELQDSCQGLPEM